jgi:DNA-binding CsgD family transcriptional regulator
VKIPEFGMELSPREKECLQLTARLGTGKLTAKNLGITEQTVKNHLSATRVKLGAVSTVQAVYIALIKGMIE